MASKFTKDHFKKLQINLSLDYHGRDFEIGDFDLDLYRKVYPKHISLNYRGIPHDEMKDLFDEFSTYSSILTFNLFSFY